MDSFAVITGASDGIGKEFALQLAKIGYNVVILSRSKTKLEQVATQVESFGVKAIVYPFDFSTANEKDYEQLKKKLDSLQIEVLINNVGISHDFPVSFLDENPVTVDRILKVNIHSLLQVTRIVLGQMVQRKKGLVLNIGSMSGKVPSVL
jgi:17beta-estradiol 17-dehydrogenase / very-long-chain 3-oxoacyl-CoA reductase